MLEELFEKFFRSSRQSNEFLCLVLRKHCTNYCVTVNWTSLVCLILFYYVTMLETSSLSHS